MKMITDAYDLLAPLAVHLNWSSPAHTLLIFQSLIIATISLFFIAPYLPYRVILLVAGEAAFLVNHPWTQPVLAKLSARIGEGKEGRRLKTANRLALAQLNEWIKMDQLPDDVWTRGWREVEVYENERFAKVPDAKRASSPSKSDWSGHSLRFGERKVRVCARLGSENGETDHSLQPDHPDLPFTLTDWSSSLLPTHPDSPCTSTD